jgi:hypothetical protein
MVHPHINYQVSETIVTFSFRPVNNRRNRDQQPKEISSPGDFLALFDEI